MFTDIDSEMYSRTLVERLNIVCKPQDCKREQKYRVGSPINYEHNEVQVYDVNDKTLTKTIVFSVATSHETVIFQFQKSI